MSGTPSPQDVADALALTLERQDASGSPWCPPHDGLALRRWVTDRSASLGTGIRRAVRLARLMAVADGRDYTRFLYARIPNLRGQRFRHALEAAAADGRVPSAVALLSGTAALLREPALAPPGGDRFEIDFAQMPRLAALLDILHNALGFTVVADLLAPLVHPGIPRTSADDIARRLHAAFSEWLRARLESTTHLMQAQHIRAFLKTRGRVVPEAVDDEAILLFWTTAATAPDDRRIDGFRLYRSAACAMLRYRGALRDATAARLIEESLQRGWDDDAGDRFVDAADAGATAVELWQSPLSALASPTASPVKWLTQREQRALLNYLGGRADDDDPPEASEEAGAPRSGGGLAGDERFDTAFWLTLLRADVFGAAQASIVGRLRKRAPAEEAIAYAIARADEAPYATAAAVYEDVRAQLRLVCLAALAILMEAGAAEAVALLDHIGGRGAAASVLAGAQDLRDQDLRDLAAANENVDPERLRDAVAPTLTAAIADPGSMPEPLRTLLAEARAATRKVSRAGFRREDRANADMVAALRAGAPAAVEIDQELERLTDVLSQKAVRADFSADRAHFAATFRQIYMSMSAK